jgi:nucleoside-diphosphate-sugar epimerase
VTAFETQEEWAGRRVLVTGGTGFLGQHLTRRLAGLGARVSVALCKDEGPDTVAALPAAVDPREGDVRDADRLDQLIETAEPELVFHLAAVGVNEPFIAAETALQVNLHGTLNLLQAVQNSRGAGHRAPGHRAPVRRVVVVGTSYEYGEGGALDPGNVYAASKVAAWAFCRMHYRAYGTPVVVARPFNVYGPGQNPRALIPAAIEAACGGRDFPTTPGEQRRDFVHVDDVVGGLIALATAEGVDGESVDLGTGQATSVRDVVERVYALVKRRSSGLTQNSGRPLIGALPYRPGVVWELVADAQRTEELTGWRAKIGLDEGLQETLRVAKRSFALNH